MSEKGVIEPKQGVASPPLAQEEVGLFAPVYPLPRLEVVSGRGARVRDASGREYLDFVSGIAVNALGHAPAGLARAVAKQMKILGHCSNLFANRPAIELAQALTQATGYDQVFFCNSGSEAVEAALKFARAHAGAQGRKARTLLAFEGSFHGRTGFAVSATWPLAYREPFEPLVPDVRFAPYNDLGALEHALDDSVAGVIVEIVQGEGGAVPATREFLRALRSRTAALGAALILDEVQTGMGRSGRFLAAEHFGLRGDMTVMSKALGGGFPLGTVLLTKEVATSLVSGMHGCTFGGSPAAAAAGLWMLKQVNRRSVLARVRNRGEELAQALAGLVGHRPSLKEARGLGLLRAVELTKESGIHPRTVLGAAREEGLLLARGGERAVRLLPPLTVTSEEIQEAAAKLDAALARVEAEAQEKVS